MEIFLYNTLTRETERFEPLEPALVRIYVCGVTPYDYNHLGHMRPAVVFDVLRRFLEYANYRVVMVVNFTDVDDKIIKRARENGEDPLTYPRKFIQDYYECMEALNIKPAHFHPKVTAHIADIIRFIEKILENGFGYVVNGNVYFSVAKFSDYGKLSGRRTEELIESGRLEPDPNKRDPLDFALWKAQKPGEPAWDSPWGKGRPGWHIECSTMSSLYLGDTFDIHGGGNDLIFPHHENEIAQSRAYSGKPFFARFWMHNGMVTLQKEKMAKSTGVFLTTRELLKTYRGEVLRLFLLSGHYRSPLDFSEELLQQTAQRLDAFYSFFQRVQETLGEELEERLENLRFIKTPELDSAWKEWESAMSQDLHTPKALSAMHSLLDYGNQTLMKGKKAEANKAFLQLLRAGEIMGIFTEFSRGTLRGKSREDHAPWVEFLLRLREFLRKEKFFALSDEIREYLHKQGFIVEDTETGYRWRKKL
ncbi:MAG: cysteine--tRNA ligase [bacterium JZ-2024 1]